MSQPRNFFQEWKERKAAAEAATEAVDLPDSGLEEKREVPADGSEDFQWSEERDQAIFRLLDTTAPGTLPSVHIQLQAIRHALMAGTLEPPRARWLLNELEGYLRSQLRHEEAKTPVDHPGVTRARDDKIKALYAWRQAAEGLREYLDKSEEIFLEVSSYAADQGSAFLASARRHILECEPEPEPCDDDETDPDQAPDF